MITVGFAIARVYLSDYSTSDKPHYVTYGVPARAPEGHWARMPCQAAPGGRCAGFIGRRGVGWLLWYHGRLKGT